MGRNIQRADTGKDQHRTKNSNYYTVSNTDNTSESKGNIVCLFIVHCPRNDPPGEEEEAAHGREGKGVGKCNDESGSEDGGDGEEDPILAGYVEAVSKEATSDSADKTLDASADDLREGWEEDEDNGDPSPENGVAEVCLEGA